MAKLHENIQYALGITSGAELHFGSQSRAVQSSSDQITHAH